MLALAVLRLLTQEPLHPYEMMRRIRYRAFDRAVKVTHGALYNTVQRLVDAGLITEVETERTGNRPERTVYAITAAGRDYAVHQLSITLGKVAPEFPAFTGALSLIATLSREEATEALRGRAIELAALVRGETAILDELNAQGLERARMLEVEQRRHALEAELTWVRSVLAEIENGTLTWPSGAGETGGGDGEGSAAIVGDTEGAT